MVKKATIKRPGEYQPIDTAHWQRIFPHDLGCSMEFIKDNRGNVDAIITTTDRFNITDRPVEIRGPGQLSRIEIHAAGYENLPDRSARNLEHNYFYRLLITRMMNNIGRFYPAPDQMIQHLAYLHGVDTTTLKPMDPPRDKRGKAQTGTTIEDAKKDAKVTAFEALAAHNYMGFARWAKVWTQMNTIDDAQEGSPFSELAEHARKILKTLEPKKKA